MSSELIPVLNDLNFEATIRGLENHQQVFGRYKLNRVLGSGGMGVVWLARDEQLERDVALKFLPDVVSSDPAAIDELKRETRRCLDLTHPNIIRIYDFIKDHQAAALSMEYIDGQTLAALRVEKEQRVFEIEELKNWMTRICDALYYVHEEVGVVHRDLKPANLMLSARGQIKIADFGIAQSISDSLNRMTIKRGSSGTIAYMSPQQMSGDIARVTDDVYALGATIYELLTGKPPFHSGNIPLQVQTIIPKSMTERRREFGITNESIPREWEEAVAACLAKSPEKRPANMLELSERLGLSGGAKARPMGAGSLTTQSRRFPNLAETFQRFRQPFRPKRLFSLGALVGASVLVGWLLYSLLRPWVSSPGALMVNSDPAGAIVHVAGRPDQSTPALFSSLRMGPYAVTLSEQGFDPVTQTVTIAAGTKLDLGTVELKRAFGGLSLATIPSHTHYLLLGGKMTGGVKLEGSTPDLLPDLPAGTYQLILDEGRSLAHTETIEVPAHEMKVEKADLIQLGVAADASPDPARVFRGEMDAGQLDDKGKSELIGLYRTAFEKYLNYGLLATAAGQLDKLKNLGQDIQAQQKELATQIGNLIGQKKVATAQEQLKNLNGVLEKESVDRLTAQFQGPLAQYQQQVGAAIKMSEDGPPATAYDQLKTFAAPYPDDLQLQLALAKVEMRLPPDHDRLVAQLKTFHQFAVRYKDFAHDPALLALQDNFANELRQLDDLSNALLLAKGGPSSTQNRIANLEATKMAIKRRRVSDGTVAAIQRTTNSFFGKIVGHPIINTNDYASEEQKEEALANVQAQIDAEQKNLSLPPRSVADAQKSYAAFMAQVPWGKS